MAKPELEERHFGSSFDPLLNGVAQGLAFLFPPVETVRLRDEDTEGRPAHDGEDESGEG